MWSVRRTWFLDLPEHAVNESVISPVVCAKERRRAVGQSLTSRSRVGPPRRGARKNAAVAQRRYQSGLCEQTFAALEHRCEALAHPFKRNAMRVQLPVLLQPAAKVPLMQPMRVPKPQRGPVSQALRHLGQRPVPIASEAQGTVAVVAAVTSRRSAPWNVAAARAF